MTTVLLALLFAMPQIQPADGVNPPVANEPYSGDDLGVLRTRPHPGLRNDLGNKLYEAEARLNCVAAFLNLATNSGMPECLLASVRREHEQMQVVVKSLRQEREVKMFYRNLCEASQRREQEGNKPGTIIGGAIIGYLCPHCGNVHASNR